MRRIEESVLIDAPREVAWRMFADLTCWADWNSVLTWVRSAPDAPLAGGGGFSCRLQPMWRFRELTRRFLLDLKSGAERRAAAG